MLKFLGSKGHRPLATHIHKEHLTMYHIEHYRTRWHDTDADRLLRPSQLMVYLQETANLHMIAAGQSLDELFKEVFGC